MHRILAGDVSLHVQERGTGRPLLLVHGFPLDLTMWRSQVEELSREFRVITPDLRGFGQSDVTPGTVTMEQYADDLAALLDAMQIDQPVVFCGLSMGGYIAWQFFARHRSKLAALILCDTKAAADSAEAAAGRLKTADKVLAEGASVVAEAMLPKLFAPGSLTQAIPGVEETRQVMLRTSPAGIAAALRGMAARPDFTARLETLNLPTLLVGGAEDSIAPPAEMRGIAAAIPGARFIEILAAGHMASLEQPQPVNQAILEFAKGLSSLP